MLVSLVLGLSSFVVAAQEMPREAPASAPELRMRVGQTAPPLDECTWVQGTQGADAGTVVRRVGGDAGGELPFSPEDIEAAVQSIGAPQLNELHGRVVVVHTFDSHDPEMIASGLLTLRDLSKAAADRRFMVVSLCDPSDVDGARRAFEYAEMENPLGHLKGASAGRYFDREKLGSRAAFVVGRSGELVWQGDLVRDHKGFCAAVDVALARFEAPRIERTVDVALEAALAEYWSGRFEKARALLKKFNKPNKDASTVAADAEHVLALIDAHERDLVARARQAGAAQAIEKLVELDLVLQAGFDRPSKIVAQEELKRIDATTLMAGRTVDARKWSELAAERPLFFPTRNDAEGKKFAKALESFVRSTPNSTPPTQKAKKLLDQFRRLP